MILNVNAEVGSDIKSRSSDSQKVLENFKVTMTKSLILSEVIKKCAVVSTSFNDITEGQLVRIDNVSLSLENEMELRTVKMFFNGSFKGMRLPETGGLDINNLFNSIFKDYSYKLKGELIIPAFESHRIRYAEPPNPSGGAMRNQMSFRCSEPYPTMNLRQLCRTH